MTDPISLSDAEIQAIADAREMAKWVHGTVGGVGGRTAAMAKVLAELLERIQHGSQDISRQDG